MSYCTSEDVNNLFGDISDDISTGMFNTAIDNSTSWIDSNLRRSYVPLPVIRFEERTVTTTTGSGSSATTTTSTISVPVNIPSALKSAAIYYAASDILLSLYHGETLPVQYDVWFNKAQDLLEAYISEQLNYTENTDTIDKVTGVKHRKSRPYTRRL